VQRVVLGGTGLEVSRLAIGTGTGGWGGRSEQTERLGFRGLADVLVHAYEKGITFFDTADQYGSHAHVREALKAIPRDRVVIATKTVARTARDAAADLDRFRRELGTDVLDVVLLHCLVETDWNVRLRPVMDVLSEAKRKGIVRAHGTSNHHRGALLTTAAEPWAEVVLVRVNAHGMQMETTPAEAIAIIRRMREAGKGLYGMKVLGGGPLRRDVKAAIRWQLNVPCHAFVIGMSSCAEVDENVALLDELSAVAA
jgi:aryl-alcohol dehydrogenase-like predicted oxidoreductase